MGYKHDLVFLKDILDLDSDKVSVIFFLIFLECFKLITHTEGDSAKDYMQKVMKCKPMKQGRHKKVR